MKWSSPRMFVVAALSVSVTYISNAQVKAKTSQWAHLEPAGKLEYRHLSSGDRILDFSYAGYMGGGVALPTVPVQRTVRPSGDDDSEAIQTAIDEVSTLASVKGFRGAVLLTPGHFHCKTSLHIEASGVVLRGSGSQDGGTILEMTGDPHLAISISGKEKVVPLGSPVSVIDKYVPSGERSVTVSDPSEFKVGDTVEIKRPVTAAWVHLMGMDTLVRNGKKQTWIAHDLTTERTILAIQRKTLRFDLPLADSYDSRYLGDGGTTVTPIQRSGLISQIGVERLRLMAPARSVTLNDKHFNGIQVSAVEDSWIRDLRILDTTEAVGIGRSARRMTITKVDVTQTTPIVGAAKPADFSANGTQLLFDRCSATGDNVFYVAVGPGEQGPNVILHCIFHGNGHIQPHQRWSTGLLIDNCTVPDGGIDLMNRGAMGSGHGWTMGWGVVWNSSAKSFLIQNPPGATNWGIGNRGEFLMDKMKTYDPGPELPLLPGGINESQDEPVAPASLYLEQLKERLGVRALRNIGY